MEEDLTVYVVDYASKLGANYVDVRFDVHYSELITVADGKIQRGIINRKHGIGFHT
jgi:predicted Zn-dependent protease